MTLIYIEAQDGLKRGLYIQSMYCVDNKHSAGVASAETHPIN